MFFWWFELGRLYRQRLQSGVTTKAIKNLYKDLLNFVWYKPQDTTVFLTKKIIFPLEEYRPRTVFLKVSLRVTSSFNKYNLDQAGPLAVRSRMSVCSRMELKDPEFESCQGMANKANTILLVVSNYLSGDLVVRWSELDSNLLGESGKGIL